MNLKLFSFIIIILFFSEINPHFPEDFSSIEHLTYTDSTPEKEEVFIGSYFHSTSLDTKNDLRNGIKLIPKDFCGGSQTTCSITSYDENDDQTWDYDTNYIYYPPTFDLTKEECMENADFVLDLSKFLSEEDINIAQIYNTSYIFYFWIQTSDPTDKIYFSCSETDSEQITFQQDQAGLNQYYLNYNSSNNIFSINDDTISFSCPSMKISVKHFYNSNLYFHRLKLTALIDKNKISNVNCNSQSRKCPISYYCDLNTEQCKKCLGKFSKCQDNDLICGRFTKEWETGQQTCNADYYNLQYLDEMTYDINPPIKSSAASLTFWLFTTKVIDDNDPKIYHITLEDFFVVTIIPGKEKYKIYVVGYEMYHEAYGTILKDKNTKKTFKEALKIFPYSKWRAKIDIPKINRWVNVIASYNKNKGRISIKIFYQKGRDISVIGDTYIKRDLDGEYIYNNENNIIKSTLHFKKFYRNSDTTHLNIKIYNNNIGVYFRKIYVFVTELLKECPANNLLGFQYIEFEKIFKTDNQLMPELVLAVPFENITKYDNRYFIEYYIYDMTKIFNNLNKKFLIINRENIEETLYTYSPGLYRLNLISEKNKNYNSDTLDTKNDIICEDEDYYFDVGKHYTCSIRPINPSNRECVTGPDVSILVPGINRQNNGKGTLTEICYGGEGCGTNSFTDFKCLGTRIFDACVDLDEDFMGYFYYSYFFKLPPIKFNLNRIYENYVIQFNFLYETNSALRPKDKLKGKKLYLFYSDGFKIWHDHTMNYLGVEDKLGNSNKNLIPNFNTENENLFTITVKKEGEIYKGKVFINGVKIYMPSFTAGSLSYILFCHNDTACPAGKDVFWTGGFYNQIKIYNLNEITILNDNSFYDLYIYNNYYTYLNYKAKKQRFNSYPADETIDMSSANIDYNKISLKEFTNPYSNDDKLQMFNYGINQTIPLRNMKNPDDDKFFNYFIHESFIESNKCKNSISCYGNTSIFSDEVRVCDNTLKTFFKYDTCESFPTTNKGEYYSLTLPLEIENDGDPLTYSLNEIKNKDDEEGKITYTFWIKLIGYKENKNIFIVGDVNDDMKSCVLYYPKFNELSLECGSYYKNKYTIPPENFGKYMHITIALSEHFATPNHNIFISFIINNLEVTDIEKNDFSNPAYIDISKFTLFTEIYAQISKFYIYNEVLIGGYAFNTNEILNLEPKIIIIDETKEDCLFAPHQTIIDPPGYKCLNDYDPALNNDFYIKPGYFSEKNVFLTKNNMYKIKPCSDKCATSCYETGENQCACTTNSYYDYIFYDQENKSYQCKKLPYFDFKRYKSYTFETHDLNIKGLDFWFYATNGVNVPSASDSLFEIELNNPPSFTISIKKDTIDFDTSFGDNCRCECCDGSGDIIEQWCHVYCKVEINGISKIYFKNSESTSTSPGIMLIRQFKLWSSFPDDEEIIKQQFYTAFINNIENGILISIDSLINSEKILTTKPVNLFISSTSEKFDTDNEEPYIGYSPVNKLIPELELCSDIEECKDIINLSGIEDLMFEDITTSGSARYTMELWIKIKHLSHFLYGINIIWDKHVSISILTDTLKDKLSLYCFPREFLSSPFSKKGREIISLAENALNKEVIDVDINNFENTWFYMRCAFNWDNEIVYFKTKTDTIDTGGEIKKVNHEIASYNNEVDYPFKYMIHGYESYNAYIQNAKYNKDCEVYIRNLYLFNEYLPPLYDTETTLFTFDNHLRWNILVVDFFKFEEIDDRVKISFFKKKNHLYENKFIIRDIDSERKYKSKGGIKLEEKINDDDGANHISKVNNKNKPLECENNYFLSFDNENSHISCSEKCPTGFNRGPGGILINDQNEIYNTSLCNYILDSNHQYQDIDNFDAHMTCLNGLIRVGFKCFTMETQINSALYFNRCYHFYQVFAYFTRIKNELINGYIIELSFKIDLVNEFCDKTGLERYLFFAHPHAITQDENDIFYYKDTNDLDTRSNMVLPLSSTEWNHVIIEFRPLDNKINIYINYNMLEPALVYHVEDREKYILNNVLFCNGENLCEPLGDRHIDWGAAYYKKLVVYNLKYSSVYMVYENMRNKFNYELNSILIHYLFNTIGNDLNKFKETYNGINLDFGENLALASVYMATDTILLFSSSSRFDFGEFHPNVHAKEITPKTGAYTYESCFPGCKRCYSSLKNDCYQCDENYELFNKECRKITGYYYQLTQEKEKTVIIDSEKIINNPITITLWVKYYGLIRNSEYSSRLPSSSEKNCPMLIQFSTVDDIFICHDQDSNNLFMYRGDYILFNGTSFLEKLGTWQLISISNYKCSFGNENSCNFYPSILSFAINGFTAERLNTYDIPKEGVTINNIIFGSGIIMIIADINFYNTFILNPSGIITNYQSYKRYLNHSIQFYSSSPSKCIESGVLWDGGDMSLKQDGQCISDYNLYHDLINFDCKSEDKMINLISVKNECLDCIPECEHCGGDSKFNCACYYNDKYWFRNDNETNRLYCELVPYLDLNKYSKLEFNEIKYATTNEYAIEFWYYIYEYNEEDIHFYDQTISWENHIKIEFTKYNNTHIKVECFPINEKDETISDNDINQTFLKWNHLVCATDLNQKLYYLNDRKVNNIIGEGVKSMNYEDYENRKVTLKFESFNNIGGTSSSGVFLIKELKLWNIFAVREFDTKCSYNFEWAKSNDLPNILHYFPFKMDKEGLIKDITGNHLPSQEIVKSDIKGYNIIDFYNKYFLDEEFDNCLIVYALPQRIYFNLTNVLIYNYEIEPKPYPFYNYTYEYYISKNGEIPYENITRSELKITDNRRELLFKKFKENHYNEVQLNIYLTLTEIETGKVHYGFTMIKIKSYYPGLDLDLKAKQLQDHLDFDLDDLSSKYDFTETEIWNRLYLFYSLGDIHSMALNDANTTTTFLDYYFDDKTVSYHPNNIIIKNPTCNDDFCSGKGKCVIVVRNMVCKCDEGYTGSNCHLTESNKEFISESHLKMWDFLTNKNEFTTLDINKELLEQITYLVKSSTMFDDSHNVLIQNFFNFVDFIKVNYFDLLIEEIKLVFDTISYIIINMYNNVQQYRANNFFSMDNPQYSSDSKIPEVDLTKEQIESVFDLSNKITTIVPELILYLVKINKEDTMQNYTGFDFTIKSLSHSFDYLEYFLNLQINNREKYNSYLPFIDAYQCADYIFGSTGYTTIFLVLIDYHFDPLAYHPQYSSSASYSLDVFFATQIGEKLDIKACPNFIDIYFPLTLYNRSEIDFINSHTQFLGENEENKNYDINDPYVTWPVYVFKNGSICRKSRYERINEVLPMINLVCSYYNSKQGLTSNISSTLVSDNYYLVCQTHHLSFYTIQSQTSKLDYKKAGKFFYLAAPRVFICGDNWGNGCSVLLIIIFFIFGVFIGLFFFLEKTLMVTKSSLNNIKLEILKQNRLIIDEVELIEEITKLNKMNEQDNMEKNLNIQTENEKVDKDLKQNLYLYGTKNIDYNDVAFEGGEKGKDLEAGYGGKGVFSNPPKKQKTRSKKKDKHVMNTGFVIDDLYEINDEDEKEDKKSENEKETNLKKSINYTNKRKQKRKIKAKPKTEDNEEDEENKNKNFRYYHVKEYNPEKAEGINKFNYNMYKDSDFGFNQSEGSEEKQQDNKIRLNSDIDSLKESTDQLDERKSKKSQKQEEKKIETENNINNNNNMHDNDDDDDGVENVDYFSKYKTVIKNENKKGGKKVIVQNGNYTIVDKYRKVTFVKEKINYVNLPDFFEQINKKDPNLIKFFLYLFLRRVVYVSPFLVSSTINPRWRRILCLYMYILLQYLFLTFEMTLGEDTKITKAGKVFFFQLINICISDLVMLAFIPFFRISTKDKRTLFLNLKSTQQMKLLKEFKIIKDSQKQKLKYIIGIMVATFIVTFYLSFNYCSVLFDSRWTFAGCFLIGIVFDCFLYEGLLNGTIILLYFLKKKYKIFNKPYIYLFSFRNYRNCF